jgi:SAM-dependent methyltransferase
MLPYQNEMVDIVSKILPSNTRNILEIGSDISCEVVSGLASRTGAKVIGINPAIDFPDLKQYEQKINNMFIMRADGRCLPFSNDSFDFVFSIATLEHVNGIEIFLAEATRVLKPKGIFYISFGPIWSCSKGHHVYAKSGSKEARFWKPGKNPIPDYAHLLMTAEELKSYLSSGPCCEELIEPIIQWIYYGNDINRCHFNEYIDVFQKSSLQIQSIRFSNDEKPNEDIKARLDSKFGSNYNYTCSGISVVFRKLPSSNGISSFLFQYSVNSRKVFYSFMFKLMAQLLIRFPEIRSVVKHLRRLKIYT